MIIPGSALGLAVSIFLLQTPAPPQDAGEEGVPWKTDPDAALKAAAEAGRPILYDFRHKW